LRKLIKNHIHGYLQNWKYNMNENKPIELFDTTLRDGTQGEGISLSVDDKIHIAKQLDEFGIDYIEGGWPGSNPKDESFFKKIKNETLTTSTVCAFGSTARFPDKIESDPNLIALLKSETSTVCIFGKSWNLHADVGLGLSQDANADLIFKSVRYLIDHGRKVIFDAEHFFDGYKDNADFAINMIKAANDAGSETIVLCDTNGGSLPSEVESIVSSVKPHVSVPLGIHAHNDSELAVSNTLIAIQSGVTHVQGGP
jgi:2-isopropylmalate synthase